MGGAKKANRVLGMISRSVVSRDKDIIPRMCNALGETISRIVRLNLESIFEKGNRNVERIVKKGNQYHKRVKIVKL